MLLSTMSHGIKHYPGKSRSNAPFPLYRPQELQPGSVQLGVGGSLEPSTW